MNSKKLSHLFISLITLISISAHAEEATGELKFTVEKVNYRYNKELFAALFNVSPYMVLMACPRSFKVVNLADGKIVLSEVELLEKKFSPEKAYIWSKLYNVVTQDVVKKKESGVPVEMGVTDQVIQIDKSIEKGANEGFVLSDGSTKAISEQEQISEVNYSGIIDLIPSKKVVLTNTLINNEGIKASVSASRGFKSAALGTAAGLTYELKMLPNKKAVITQNLKIGNGWLAPSTNENTECLYSVSDL